MSAPERRPSPPSPTPPTHPRIVVDRIACSGHGICAQLLPDRFDLDEWGYPIVYDDRPPSAEGDTAIRLCPARALSWG